MANWEDDVLAYRKREVAALRKAIREARKTLRAMQEAGADATAIKTQRVKVGILEGDLECFNF